MADTFVSAVCIDPLDGTLDTSCSGAKFPYQTCPSMLFQEAKRAVGRVLTTRDLVTYE